MLSFLYVPVWTKITFCSSCLLLYHLFFLILHISISYIYLNVQPSIVFMHLPLYFNIYSVLYQGFMPHVPTVQKLSDLR